MSATRDILEEVLKETGVCWNENSMIEILCEYIDQQVCIDTFVDYIRRRAGEEVKD
jgi:hypothetical protein